MHNPFISKVGVNGTNICNAVRTTCPTRHVFMDFAAQHRDQLDVTFSGKRPMIAHTAYKYLVNLEVSSRFCAVCESLGVVRAHA